MSSSWCASPYEYHRRPTRVVRVGDVGIGGLNPIRIQSMTTPATTDTAGTVAQIVRLVEAGCEIVRVTVPTSADARSLPEIRRELAARKIRVPLVADIHFSPGAALKAVEHVEKIRVNPGNYADRKQFAVREYTDAEYGSELQRLEETFRPLVLRAKQLGVAMRIGTNHGSLSDRILNRYGDSPLGMVESALEFVRICEANGYRDLVISMKSSNPVVTIEAYRLLAARMAAEEMDYPFHLGVTEAGDGEDGRVKSAIGIGALLDDGIGDTIRVSLTEDPVAEVPVAQALVAPYNRLLEDHAAIERAPGPRATRGVAAGHALEREGRAADSHGHEGSEPVPALPFDPFSYARRASRPVRFGPCTVGGGETVRVEVRLRSPLSDQEAIRREIDAQAGPRVPAETRADLVEAQVGTYEDLGRFRSLLDSMRILAPSVALSASLSPELAASLATTLAGSPGADRISLPAEPFLEPSRRGLIDPFSLPAQLGSPILLTGSARTLLALLRSSPRARTRSAPGAGAVHEPPSDADSRTRAAGIDLAASANEPIHEGANATRAGNAGDAALAVSIPAATPPATCRPSRARGESSRPDGAAGSASAVHEYRELAAGLTAMGLDLPIVLSFDTSPAGGAPGGLQQLLGASLVLGSLLCDGIGDAVTILADDATAARAVAFNILQGARVRISKTEFISCPSCGRTLFDLEETTRRIKLRTAHLKGLKIAVMGCVVNGPGEMADADFGYVGWGSDKIALFVGREMVARDIPTEQADDRLVELIKQHGKWQDPVPAAEPAP